MRATLGSALVGALAAVIVVVILDDDAARPVGKAAPATPADTVVRSVAVPAAPQISTDRTRIDALERELQRLREQQAPPSTAPSSPAEERAQIEEKFEEFDLNFERDVPDGTSRESTTRLHEALASLGANEGFTIITAECRATHCRAQLRWATFEAARSLGSTLPMRMTIPGLNCQRSIWLKEPEDPEAVYTAAVYLDCSEQRAGLAESGEGESQ